MNPRTARGRTPTRHWHLLCRARAVENLCYLLAPGQGGLHDNGRRTYGHSLIAGPWGAVLFALLYTLAAVLLLPGVILTLGAGAVFGLIEGFVLVSCSATLAATAAFFVGRYLARGWVVKRIEAYPRFKAIDEAVASEGWKIISLTRLSPAFPFNLLNYAFGVTRVSPRDYILASWIGMMPGTRSADSLFLKKEVPSVFKNEGGDSAEILFISS